ncbi:MAG: hypothetical protein AB1757_01835 [Acidobacteriota bacterium]
MLKKARVYWLFLILLGFCVATLAQTYTPKAGTPERKAIMDALRAPVEKELGKQVVFKVDHLKLQGDWAFMRGVPQQPGGKRMDYRGTAYQQAIKDGIFDDWICALLKKQNGKWRVIRYVIGATDVVYEGWDKEYRAPSAIFQ